MIGHLCSKEKIVVITTITIKLDKDEICAAFPLLEIFIATGQKYHNCEALIGDAAVILMVWNL